MQWNEWYHFCLTKVFALCVGAELGRMSHRLGEPAVNSRFSLPFAMIVIHKSSPKQLSTQHPLFVLLARSKFMSLVLVAHIIRLQKMPSSKLVPPLFCRNLVLKGSFFPEIFFFFFNIRSDVLVTISVGQCCFHLRCLLSCFRLPVSVGKVIATSHCIHLYLLCFIMSACFLCNLGIRACCCHLWMTN